MGFKMKFPIIEDYLPITRSSGKRRRQGREAKCEIGAVHDTGNISSTAKGNINWYRNTVNEYWSGANFFTDYKEIRIAIPLFLGVDKIERACSVNASAGLDNKLFGGDCNDIGVSGEMCYFKDKSKTWQSYSRFVFMWAYVGYRHEWMKRFGTISGRLIGHYQLQPHNRTDPMNAFKTIGVTWERFLDDVDRVYQECAEEDMKLDDKDLLKALKKCGYREGLDCKDLNILTLEIGIKDGGEEVLEKYGNDKVYDYMKETDSDHSIVTTGMVSKYLKNSNSVLAMNDPSAYQEWYLKPTHIIGLSISAIRLLEKDLLEMSNQSFLQASSGNRADEGVYDTHKFFTLIGASYFEKDKIKMRDYSSYDINRKLVDFTGIDGYEFMDKKRYGTSYSRPFSMILLGQAYQLFINKYKIAPTPLQMYEFMKRYSIDICEAGEDIYSGHGLFVLPIDDEIKFFEKMEIEQHIINAITPHKHGITVNFDELADDEKFTMNKLAYLIRRHLNFNRLNQVTYVGKGNYDLVDGLVDNSSIVIDRMESGKI